MALFDVEGTGEESMPHTKNLAQMLQEAKGLEMTHNAPDRSLRQAHEKAVGMGEAALTMASSAVAEPVSGYAGLIAKARGEDPAAVISHIQDAMTYQPRSQKGAEYLGDMGETVQSVVNSVGLEHAPGYWRDRVAPAMMEQFGEVTGAAMAALGLGMIMSMGDVTPAGRGGSAALRMGKMGANTRGVFAGIPDMSPSELKLLEVARKMRDNGATREQIWQDTGMFEFIPGSEDWRVEIPDDKAMAYHGSQKEFNKEMGQIARSGQDVKMAHVMAHPDLEERVPEILEKTVIPTPDMTAFGPIGRLDDKGKVESGFYMAEDNYKNVGPDNYEPTNTLIHEIQHYMSNRAGGPRGGSPDEFPDIPRKRFEKLFTDAEEANLAQIVRMSMDRGMSPKEAREILIGQTKNTPFKTLNMKRVLNLATTKTLPELEKRSDNIIKMLKRLQQKTPMESYRRLADEGLARAAQKRHLYTPEQRKAAFPPDDFDVDEDNMIVRYNSNALGKQESRKGVELDRERLLTDYPETGEPLLTPKESGKGMYPAKVDTPQEAALRRERIKVQNKFIKTGEYEPFYDVDKRYPVDSSLYPMIGSTFEDTKPKILHTKLGIQRLNDKIKLYDTPQARKALVDAFNYSVDDPKAHNWYFMGQMFDDFVKELGQKEGQLRFRVQFAKAMAATTGGATPGANLLMAQYGNFLRARGMAPPIFSYEYPHPIGGKMLTGNMRLYDKFINQGVPMTAADHPKRFNFEHNFLGHELAVIDDQMMGGMTAHLPKKLGAPPGGTYHIFERIVMEEADKVGMLDTAGGYQGVVWTGFKRGEGEPMIEWVNETLARTSIILQIPQWDVLKGWMHGTIPILTATGFGVYLGPLTFPRGVELDEEGEV